MARRSSLTGAWSGAYRYPSDTFPETVFNARIEEIGGAFTGTTQEPNILRLDHSVVITADIDGIRTGAHIRFTKFMDGSGGLRHAIHYDGEINGALTRIEGVWTIPGEWSGTFFMTREDDEAEATAAAEASVFQGERRR